MTQVTRHPAGRWNWMELATSDPEAAKGFYGELFGWDFHDTPAGPGMTYTFIRLDGDDVGALYAQPKEQQDRGVPPHWLLYVAVDDADAVAARAGDLGGRVTAGPFDIGSAGRSAFLADPRGAVFGLWQAKEHPGAHRIGETGAMIWTELATDDLVEAERFYTGLFGWGVRTDTGEPPYTEFRQGETSVAGMLEIQPEWGPVPPHWGHYVSVDDPDAVAARAEELGGRLQVPPKDVPEVGRMAQIVDPQGARLSVIRLET